MKVKKAQEEIDEQEMITKEKVDEIYKQHDDERKRFEFLRTRVSQMEDERESKKQAAHAAIAAMKRELSTLSVRLTALQHESAHEQQCAVDTIVQQIVSSRCEDEITTRLYELRQAKVAAVMQTLSIASDESNIYSPKITTTTSDRGGTVCPAP